MKDESGYSNHFQILSSQIGFAEGQDGSENGSIQFLSEDSSLTSAKNLSIQGNQQHTFSLWVSVDELARWSNGEGALLTVGGGGGAGAISQLFIDDFAPAGRLVASGPYSDLEVLNLGGDFTGRWHHLVFIYTGSISTSSIFINGSKANSTLWQGGNWLDIRNIVDSPIRLGRTPSEISHHKSFPRAKLSDIRIYNRALSAAEVLQIYIKEAFGMLVTVLGGTLPQGSELAGQTVETFQIGKYEVTWGEWKTVRDWAVANGYHDLANVGAGSADNHPVRNVSWYDVVKWCNAKSEMAGFTPVYLASGDVYKTGQSNPTVDSNANGYRLPLEKEWEWAARGGVGSQGFNYSGSNNLNDVGWYRDNSISALVDLGSSGFDNPAIGCGTWPVGQKSPNELGIFDISGNISEWCWDVGNDANYQRHFRGPSWYNYEFEANVATRVPFGDALSRISVTGFRLARNAP